MSDLDDQAQGGLALPRALETVPVQRCLEGEFSAWMDDQVVAEVPVALVFNGISHAVMMCTPQDLSELALGFALSEGIIERPQDCFNIEVAAVDATGGLCAQPPGAAMDPVEVPAIEVRLEIASRAFMRLKEQRRSLAGRTGCGVCGIDNLQALDLVPSASAEQPWVQAMSPSVVFDALSQMPAWQHLNKATGAVHAAGLADVHGQLIAVYEDVGRHNALDKLLGARAMAASGLLGEGAQSAKPWPEQGFVVMSSRASYELVRKCARLGIPLLATISAPTSLAIQVAKSARLQLWGLVRAPRAVRYTV